MHAAVHGWRLSLAVARWADTQGADALAVAVASELLVLAGMCLLLL